MKRPRTAVLAAILAVMVVECHGFPRPLEPTDVKGKAALGSTYDEIVVETQLAVRPKVAGAGLALRTGRTRPGVAVPKAVFFRPTTTTTVSASSTSPTTAPASSTTTSDGISFAARVVGVENPLATGRRERVRSRRSSEDAVSGGSSSSSYSFRSSSGSSSSSGPGARAGGRGSSSSAWSQQLPGGRPITVSATDDFEVSQGSGSKAPTTSRLRSIFVSNGSNN